MTWSELMEREGWTFECESPLEIRHEDGSFATLNAAEIIINTFRNRIPMCNAVKITEIKCTLPSGHTGPHSNETETEWF